MTVSYMPDIKPKLETRRQRTAESGDFYQGLSQYSKRDVTPSRIHERQQPFIKRIVTLWNQGQEKNNKPFTGFQNRIIELHNNAKKFGSDPEDALRLFSFLAVFKENDGTYTDAQINKLTNGTFNSHAEVDTFLARTFEGDKKWKASFGKISLTRESDPDQLAQLSRKALSQEQLKFRASIIPHSQFESFGLSHRLAIHLATKFKHLHLSNDFKHIIETIESGDLAKFDLLDPTQLQSFLEKGTCANIDSILKGQAEGVSSSNKVKTAKEKGHKQIASAAEQENLDRLRLNGFQRHAEVMADINSIEDFLQWVHKDLSFDQVSKFEAVLALAKHNPETLTGLLTELGLPVNSSPEKIFEFIETLDETTLQTAADNLEVNTIRQLGEGPWYLKTDAAYALLERKLDQISSEAEILPKFEFSKANFENANLHHAASLMAHGFTAEQLSTQKMKESVIKEAITTYFKHDEDDDLIPDASGKPQFKESKEPQTFKQKLRELKELRQYQTPAQNEIRTQLTNDNEEVLIQYQVHADAQAAIDSKNDLIGRGFANPTPANINSNKPIFLATYWNSNNNRPITSHPHHNAWINSSKTEALTNSSVREQIATLQEELRDKDVAKYHREHISQTTLAQLGTVQLAGLVESPVASLPLDDLPEPIRSEVGDITNADDFSAGNVDRLKQYIIDNPSLVRGMNLSVLLAMFSTISETLLANLSEAEQNQYKQLFT